jgi:hypothetical protein
MTKNIVNKAFSLIDFAIWITIFSVMVIGFLAISSAQNKHKNFVADNLEKQLIQNKINSYVLKEISNSISNSNIILHKSCDNAGLSTLTPCSVKSEAGKITEDITDSAIKDNIGYVPYKTLGLNQEEAIDSNNKFYMFLAYRIDSQSQYQYYVFSQTEEAIDINKIIDNKNVQNQNQNTIMPTQIPNCYIAVTISKTASQTTANDYIDILSGSLKDIDCQRYNILSNNIIYKNNANPALPNDDKINFECFSGKDDYIPQNQKCERVCTTFSAGGITYNIEPAFFNGLQTINPAGSYNSTPSQPYSNIYDSLNISKSFGPILKLKCGENYIYEVDSITTSNPCQTNYELSADRKSCQYTCAINPDSIGVGSNTARYLNGTTYQQIINDTVCISNTKAKDSTLSNQNITCTEANPIVTLTSGSDTYQICQCDSANYYVKKGAANECVRGCKMRVDMIGPGDMADSNKLYYPGQPASEVVKDVQCLTNASANKSADFGILPIQSTKFKECVFGTSYFGQKLCTCDSGYSMLAKHNIANLNEFISINRTIYKNEYKNFPGNKAPYSSFEQITNYDAEVYDCFTMCSATTSDIFQQNVVDTNRNLTNLAIGYDKNEVQNSSRKTKIIDSLNSIAFKQATVVPADNAYLLSDKAKNKKILQPLTCDKSQPISLYRLRIYYDENSPSTTYRLFMQDSEAIKNSSIPHLQIYSGGSF